MVIIGIDNGLHGAVAVLDVGGVVHEARITPTVPTGVGTRREYAVDEMAFLIRKYQAGGFADHCYIEWAQAYPKQGGVSNFTTGRGFGLWLGILAALQIPLTPVRPRAWQREMFAGMGKGDTKAKSIRRASELFPTVNLVPEKCRTKHDGMSDALLIAEYGRRQLNPQPPTR